MRGERATPFRGATSEHMGFLENPDQEAADRTREARDASEKARRYLKERQSAQDLLKVQVQTRNAELNVTHCFEVVFFLHDFQLWQNLHADELPPCKTKGRYQ